MMKNVLNPKYIKPEKKKTKKNKLQKFKPSKTISPLSRHNSSTFTANIIPLNQDIFDDDIKLNSQ